MPQELVHKQGMSYDSLSTSKPLLQSGKWQTWTLAGISTRGGGARGGPSTGIGLIIFINGSFMSCLKKMFALVPDKINGVFTESVLQPIIWEYNIIKTERTRYIINTFSHSL